MASNAMFSSPEEIQRLSLLLKKDPSLETSSSWPHLVEWCSLCTSTRAVKLVLPMEEKEVVEEVEEAAAGEKVGGRNESCDATAKGCLHSNIPTKAKEEGWTRQSQKENACISTYAHCQARTAPVPASSSKGDQHQDIFEASGGVCFATAEGGKGGGEGGEEGRGD